MPLPPPPQTPLCLLLREEAIPWMAPHAPRSPRSTFPKAGEKDEAFQTQFSVLASHQSQDTRLRLSQLRLWMGLTTLLSIVTLEHPFPC